MSMKKARTAIIASALVGCLAIGGISAYFTDADTATNTFTVGKVEIDLQEPSWNPDEDSKKFENITPEQEIPKDPKILNTGINEAYVFMEVTVPAGMHGGEDAIYKADEDGSIIDSMDETVLDGDGWARYFEYFNYTIDSTNWVEVTGEINGVTYPYGDVNEGLYTLTHLYAYAKNGVMTAVEAGKETTPLFPAVKFANILENDWAMNYTDEDGTEYEYSNEFALEGETLGITVNAYAIQTANINNDDNSIDGVNGAGKTAPADVFAVISKQAPVTDKGNENLQDKLTGN